MKIYFAGAENTQSARVLQEMKVKNILMSYYYLRIKDKSDFIKLVRDYRDMGVESIMIDSGAHTFFAEAGLEKASNKIKKTKTEEPIDVYIDKYLHWAETLKEYFDYAVELDIGAIVGLEKVEIWRERMVKVIGKEKMMPCYHADHMDIKYFEEKLCQEYPFVAIGAGHEGKLGEWNSYLSIAQKHKTKIHGFAMTKHDFMTKLPLFSSDSTSWKAGSQYGQTFVFQRNRLAVLGDKRERRKYKNFFEENGLNWEKIERDETDEVDKMNILAWKKYEDYLDSNQQNKYWLKRSPEAKKDKAITPLDKAKRFGEHFGSIAEKKKNPKVQAAWLASMKGNLFGFKHGKFVSNLPLYCNNCYAKGKCQFYQEPKEGQKIVCALQESFRSWFNADTFDVRDEEIVNDTKNRMLSVMLQRLGLQFWFECLDGGIQDKAATALAGLILDKLTKGSPTIIVPTQININQEIVNSLHSLDEKTREKLISTLREAVNRQEQEVKSERDFVSL